MPSYSSLRILFVEDSEDDTELLLNALAETFTAISWLRVETAPALREALTRQDWDVIICDYNLPMLDAPAVLRIAQEHRSQAPFFIVSGTMPEKLGVATMMAGAADMINKDNLSRLVPAVKRELRKSAEIAELQRTQEHLQQMTYFDRLTGLPNRTLLARQWETWLGTSPLLTPASLVVIKLSRISLIRRTLGIEAAEETLRLAGERLCASVTGDNLVGRLEDEEFAVLLFDPGYHLDAVELMARINESFAQPLQIAGQELIVPLHAGIAAYPHDGHDFHKLVVNAEIAMSQVELGCRPNYRHFHHDMDAGQEKLALEQALRRAVQQDEFALHYQPQYDAASGVLIGMEALLRWQLPDGTCMPPANFIPLLEETGLIVPVGEWVLRTACQQNLAWQQAGHPPVPVAVNLSAIQFRQPDLVPMVSRVLAETGLERRFLELEITENVAMQNEELVIERLSQLRAMGVSLAIDDFGTGYSSLSYLHRFPVHKLKIDRSFIRGITDQVPDSAIVRTIISLACNLGLGIIAEGVETRRQVDFLLYCGCKQMQGYLFSRPLQADEMIRWRIDGNS